ncbi:formate dehydrogenase family accessory protein FdhD [Snodgrassella communis]|jgi:FdhD protein|uniref:Sulfur carrier protein FdhD n=2 Tax=Snodgrassella TaxID=1193515 RepID=A0A2N9XHU4_9NEIS|nr:MULTISPECIES: formate dehydrogenase accessory sulfurtransferase FdhD [Snodgrassella]KDN15551.1 Formate dehydrogenase chain D [Snodgrassella communis]PIT07221.1 formate dehydrogenase family accessory protein FdhD [Snodgrassella communis]PIT11413.1 formate dehydrogenase family accessory protein FdhD [Snodgrassella communis]PIT19768.1 formate dehydrogenase family accessory protein FdhD [Snodgrassella communis]PIT22151.1 formate dehydrogenase family accessory protein FdhD [Snodgrassella communi
MNHTPAQSRTVWVAQAGQCSSTSDNISAEIPVALVYNGISHVVLMATPANITELALGFSLSEGIIENAEQIYAIDVSEHQHGIMVEIELASAAFSRLKSRRRQMSGRTGCGLCGIDSLAAVQPELKPVLRTEHINFSIIGQVLTDFNQCQQLRAQTGSVHGVVWADMFGRIVTVREDIGRHNALDKLIGWGLRTKVDWKQGFVVLSSRASFEMVMKSAITGIGCIVAVSAPTTYAIDLAHKANITLVGFARCNRQVIYTHPQYFHP